MSKQDSNTNTIIGLPKVKLLQRLVNALAKATYLFGFTYKQFVSSYKIALVKEGKKRGFNISDIATRAGLDRRLVSQFFDDSHTVSTNKNSARFDVLEKLYKVQNECYQGEPLPMKDFIHIVKNHGDGMVISSPKSFLKLICSESVGCAEDLKTHVNIKSPCLNGMSNIDELCKLFSANIDRYIGSVEKNLLTSTDSQKLFERMVSSTLVHPDRHDEINKFTYKVFFEALRQVKAKIAENESQVEGNTYPEIGAHIVQFFSQPEVNHEEGSNSSSIVSIDKRKRRR